MQEYIWDRETVKDWFSSALYTVKKLPREKVQGYKTYWPGIRYTELELLQMDKKPIKLVASSFDIARLDAVLDWIYWIKDLDVRKLVWMRAKRYPWKIICQKYGLSRQCLSDRLNEGLDIIVKNLNNPKHPDFIENHKLLVRYLSY